MRRNYRNRRSRRRPVEQDRQKFSENFGLEFNEDRYAFATDEFWRARKQRKRIVGSYMPHKIEGRLVGMPHRETVWVVFINGFLRDAFLGKCRREGLIE